MGGPSVRSGVTAAKIALPIFSTLVKKFWNVSTNWVHLYNVVPTITVGVQCLRGWTGADRTVFFTQAEKLNHRRVFESPISEPLVVR